MSHSKLLLNQRFSFEDVITREEPSNLQLSEDEKHLVQERWQELEAKGKAEGRTVWDGLTYRLNSFEVKDNQLHLEVAELRFSVRWTLETLQTKKGHEHLLPNGFAASPFVETSDNKFLFGKLSGKTMSVRTHGTFGGIFSKDDQVIQSSEDLWQIFLQELQEEAGILEQHIVHRSVEGVVRSHRGVVMLIAHIKLNITADEARERFTQRGDNEMKELIAVGYDEVFDLLKEGNFAQGQDEILQRIIDAEHE